MARIWSSLFSASLASRSKTSPSCRILNAHYNQPLMADRLERRDNLPGATLNERAPRNAPLKVEPSVPTAWRSLPPKRKPKSIDSKPKVTLVRSRPGTLLQSPSCLTGLRGFEPRSPAPKAGSLSKLAYEP